MLFTQYILTNVTIVQFPTLFDAQPYAILVVYMCLPHFASVVHGQMYKLALLTTVLFSETDWTIYKTSYLQQENLKLCHN